MKGIKITMPFIHVNSKSDEVSIENDDLFYSEINSCGYGLQVNNILEKDEIKNLCFEISERVKKLHKLTQK